MSISDPSKIKLGGRGFFKKYINVVTRMNNYSLKQMACWCGLVVSALTFSFDDLSSKSLSEQFFI